MKRKLNRRISLILICLMVLSIAPVSVFAEGGTLSGVVKNEKGEAIEGATVEWLALIGNQYGRTTTTDENGAYSLHVDYDYDYQICASAIGYYSELISITVSSADQGLPDFTLRSSRYPYVNGYPDNNFCPDSNITRAEAVQMIFTTYNADPDNYYEINHSYPDVSKDEWFYDAVMQFTEMGYINGYPDNSFRPDEECTRAEFITIIVTSFYRGGVPIFDYFPDVSDDHWAYYDIAQAKGANYISGYPDGSFQPDEKITRAEAVTIINRAIERSAVNFTYDGYIMPFSDVASSHWAYYEIMEAAVDSTF